jgi:hypothetical protein
VPPDFVIPSEFLVTVGALHVNSRLALLGSMQRALRWLPAKIEYDQTKSSMKLEEPARKKSFY